MARIPGDRGWPAQRWATITAMSSAGATGPVGSSARVIAIEPEEGTEGLAWAEWLAALEDDEPVTLARPAAEYLHEARAAGEV